MNKIIKRIFNNKGSLRAIKVRNDSQGSNFICEEFCYISGLKTIQSPIFPSKIFGKQNINYILTGIKKAESLTNK